MRLFSVWVYLAWKNALDGMARYTLAITGLGDRLSCFMLRHTDYRLWLSVRRRLHCRWLLPRGLRSRSAVAAANRYSLLGSRNPQDFTWLMQRRMLLDLAAVYAHNAQLLSQLARCSAQLNRVVEPLHRVGKPVLLAPMHTVSDVLATLVGAGVYPGRATVIVSGDAQEYVRQAPAHQWQQHLDYCSIHDDRRLIAGKLAPQADAADNHEH